GKPVVVGGRPEWRGVVAAASYEARRYGIHSAIASAHAVRRCPDLVFLKLDVSEHLGSWGRATAIAREIRRRVREERRLTVSVGVGPNRLVAKIASDF